MSTSRAVDSALMRGHHEGSITKRKDGSWQIAVTMPDGPRRYGYMSRGASKAELRAKLAVLLAERDARRDPTATSHLGPFLRRWLADSAPSLRPSTLRHYRLIVETHLEPALGRHRLSELTPAMVQRYLGEAGARLSPQTVRHHRAVLRRALNVALAWGLVTRNAAALTRPPRVVHRELRVLDAAETARLLRATADDRLHALYVLAARTGMRQAEVLGLTWRDVDVEAGLVTIARALTRRAGGWELVEPKTDRSRRTISVGQAVSAALRAHRTRQHAERLAAGAGGAYDGLVFTTAAGLPLHESNLLRAFRGQLERAGLPRVRFHDLRHGVATMLLAEGYTLEDVKTLLGHSTIALTSDTYSHLVRERSRAVADGMERIIAEAG